MKLLSRLGVYGTLLSISGFAIPVAFGQSLSHSVGAGLEYSPVIREAIETANIALSDIDIAKSKIRPQLTLDAATGPAYRDRSIDGVATGSGDTLMSRRGSLAIEQILFDWGMNGHLIKSAELRKDFADLLAEEVRHNEALNIASTYIDLVKSREQRKLTQERIAFLNEKLGEAQQRSELQGIADKSVILGRLAAAKAESIELDGQIRALEARYAILTTLQPGALSMPTVPASLASYRYSEASPRFRAAIKAIGSSEENVHALRKDLRPKFYLGVSGGLGYDVLGINGPDNHYNALMLIRWNIFEGGRKQASIRRARTEVMRDEAALAGVRRSINDNFAVAEALAVAHRVRQHELGIAVNELTDVKGQYEAKLGAQTSQQRERVSLINIVQVFGERNRTQIDIVDAEAEAAITSLEALKAAGKLLEFLGVE